MWGFFSKDPLKDFGYEIGECIDSQREPFSLWSFHNAKKKGSSTDDYSAFVINHRPGEDYHFAAAKNGYKRLKSLRHPNILAFQDGVETEKTLYLVTEPVIPLRMYLTRCQLTDFQLAWGIYQIAKAIWFLNKDGQLIHNAVCIWNVFVTRSGDWKLAGLDFTSPATGEFQCPKNLLSALERYWPPTNQRNVEKWVIDSFGLGCLIWEIFNCPTAYERPQMLKSTERIPRNVLKQYTELVSPQASQRPSAQAFIDSCRSSKGGFFDSQFFNSMSFIEEIQLKDNTERLRFLEKLPSQLDNFPEDVRRYKLLPQLISALDYAADSGPAILGPLVKIGKLLETTEYQTKIVPCIVKLFASPDRQTRVRLLAQMEDYVEHLSVAVVNEQIYTHLSLGFSDVNPVVREATVKSIACLAPKLNHRNLNEDILRHFSRLQSRDDQPGVRVNTTVCIGKIAPCLNPQTRQRVLAPALARALRDPFSPARQAGILALVATAQFYTLAETAGRVVPAISPLMADPDQAVRQQAFRGIKGFLEKLEKASENPSIIPELEKHVNTTSSVAGGGLAESASSWAGWAFTSMSSLMSKVQKQQQQQQQQQSQQQTQGSQFLEQQSRQANQQQQHQQDSSASAGSAACPVPSSNFKKSSPHLPKKESNDDDVGGWDDFDIDIDDNSVGDKKPNQNGSEDRLALSSANAAAPEASDWDDDNWLPLDDPISTSSRTETTTNFKSASKQPTSFTSSNWDDFDVEPDNSMSSFGTNSNSSSSRTQSSATHRGSRPQPARGNKPGPLKLGAKKL